MGTVAAPSAAPRTAPHPPELLSVAEWQLIDAANTHLLNDPQLGLRYFIEDAWQILEPENPFQPNWHLDALADLLMAITREEIFDVVINMPPRLGKSLTVTVFWPCWEWGPAHLAYLRCLFFTYQQNLTLRDARKRRQIMDSAWFRSRWPHVRIGQGPWETNNAYRYDNDKRGFHLSTSVGGMGTGEGGHRIIADDANNVRDIHSESIREGVNTWWTEVIPSRRNPGGRRAARIIMAQRAHERDLSGYVLAQQAGYLHLFLPMEYDPRRICILPPLGAYEGFHDPRTQKGEILHKTLFPPQMLASVKQEMQRSTGTSGYEAQFNQNPEPAGRGILHRDWWRYWAPAGHPLVGKLDEQGCKIVMLPKFFDRTQDHWDMAFKQGETNSFVVGQAWGIKGLDLFLRYMRREHLDFIQSVSAVLDLDYLSRSQAIYVEDKANGPAILSVLQSKLAKILPASVQGSKESRAHAAAPSVEAGHVFLPHPSLPPGIIHNEGVDTTSLGVEAILHECSLFPNGAYKDIVDAFTQAHKYLYLVEAFGERNFSNQDLGL